MGYRNQRVRRMPRNLLRDPRTFEDVLDEMANKWAMRAEKLQRLQQHKKSLVRNVK